MRIIDEFKKFALRGNVVDLAIGFTVGAAFTTVVKSLVNDVVMPPLSTVTGNVDFSDRFIVLDVPRSVEVPEGGFTTLKAAQEVGAVTLNYGLFLNSCLSLLIVALAMFFIIRLINRVDEELDERFSEPRPSTEPSDKKCEYCRSTVPFRATRCPYCTSEIAVPEVRVSGNA